MVTKGKTLAATAALAIATLAMGCATTEMTNTWTDPSAKGAAMSRIAVVCMTKDPGLRRMAEDATAAQMAGAQATPSYQVLGDSDLKDRAAVKAKLKAAGFNGVLVMRLAGINEQVTAMGPYDTFDGYYDWGVGASTRRGTWRPTPSSTSSATCTRWTRTSWSGRGRARPSTRRRRTSS